MVGSSVGYLLEKSARYTYIKTKHIKTYHTDIYTHKHTQIQLRVDVVTHTNINSTLNTKKYIV